MGPPVETWDAASYAMMQQPDVERRKRPAVLLVEALGDEFGEADVVHGGEELAVRHVESREERSLDDVACLQASWR